MKTIETGTRITLQNILFLTDFSEPLKRPCRLQSEFARGYGAKTFALHVLRPDPLLYSTPASVGLATKAQEENAKAEIQRIGSHLPGMPHETMCLVSETPAIIWARQRTSSVPRPTRWLRTCDAPC